MTSTGNRTRVARMVAQWFNHYATATQCNHTIMQPAITCSKLLTGTLKQGVKYVQS